MTGYLDGALVKLHGICTTTHKILGSTLTKFLNLCYIPTEDACNISYGADVVQISCCLCSAHDLTIKLTTTLECTLLCS